MPTPERNLSVVGDDGTVPVRFILGADVCIQILETKPVALLERLAQCRPGEIGVSTVTIAELRYWAARSQTIVKTNESLRGFLKMVQILYFDDSAATVYGATRSGLEQSGITVDPLEALVAAHAISLGAVYVTANPMQFGSLRKLRVEDWNR